MIGASILLCAAASTIVGIWQLYQPFLSQVPAAGWLFIAPGAAVGILLISTFIIKQISRGKKAVKAEPEQTKNVVINTNSYHLPETQIQLPPEIWERIFSFVGPFYVVNVDLTCKYFYILQRNFVASNKHSILSKNDLRCTLHEAMPGSDPLGGIVIFQKNPSLFLYKSTGETWERATIFLGLHSLFCFSQGKLFTLDLGAESFFIWRYSSHKWSKESYQINVNDDVESIAETQCIFCKDGYFFKANKDYSITIFQENDASYEKVMRLRGHLGQINQMLFENGLLFSASNDRSIKIWNVLSGARRVETISYAKAVTFMTYQYGLLISGCNNGKVSVWHPRACGWTCLQSFDSGLVIRGIYLEDQLLAVADGTHTVYYKSKKNISKGDEISDGAESGF